MIPKSASKGLGADGTVAYGKAFVHCVSRRRVRQLRHEMRTKPPGSLAAQAVWPERRQFAGSWHELNEPLRRHAQLCAGCHFESLCGKLAKAARLPWKEAEVDGGSRGKSCPRRSSVCYSPSQALQGHGWRRAVAAGPNPLPRSKARPGSMTCSLLCNATPRRLLVKVELVHEAASVAKPRWLASLVRWTESRTSLGSVLKFAGWPDGHRCRGFEKGEVV